MKYILLNQKKDLYENLKEKTKNLQNYNVINKAVSLNDDKTLFNICNYGGASSILPFKNNNELIKHWGYNRTDIFYSGISYEVETIRLDTFIKLNIFSITKIDENDSTNCEYNVYFTNNLFK